MPDTLTQAETKRLIKRGLTATLTNVTLELKVYPGKKGMISSYPSSYCLYLRKQKANTIKEYQMTPWNENYLEVYTLYNLLKEAYE